MRDENHDAKKRLDWFQPAMDLRGSLAYCLDQVIRNEESKLAFIRGLKQQLCTPSHPASDQISELRKQIFDFVKTLEIRLTALSFDRPLAWFRESLSHELGPFPGDIHKDPVFLKFDPLKAKVLKVELKAAWTQKASRIHSFESPGGRCLWLTLLSYNESWENLCLLPPPFADLRLDELPEALPDELFSGSLQTFLQRVRGALHACRRDLDQCYNLLWKASDPFLAKQFSDACLRQRFQEQEGNYQSRTQQGASAFPGGSQLKEALTFMRFHTLPSKDDLKRRYRSLAKEFHPDRSNGSKEKFHLLTQSYHQILRQIEV